jgi:O-acetyl-ADP-ribose deacetylase (regulator of RNase III)
MIKYRKGDATDPVGSDQKYIVHVCNNLGGWGRGFVLAISEKWPEPERAYREWHKTKHSHLNGHFELGNIQPVRVSQDIMVVNMIAQDGYGQGNKPPISYEALELCLEKAAASARAYGASIHGPRFGTRLAGGNWFSIAPIIERTMKDLSVTIYDFEEK